MADTYDPNKINVSLSLLSGADSAAAKDLAEALVSVSGHFQTIRDSFGKYEDKLAKIANQLERITATDSAGGASTPTKAAQAQQGYDPDRERANPLRPPTPQEAATATAAADAAATGEPAPGGTSRPLTDAKGPIGRWISTGYNAAHTKRGAPGYEDASAVNWVQKRLGTIVGSTIGKESMQEITSGDIGLGEASLRNPMNTYYGVKGAVDTARAVAAQFPEMNFSAAGQSAAVTGLQGETTSLGPLSFRNPFAGDAGKQTMENLKRSFGERWKGGLTAEEAQGITASMSEAGLSGDQMSLAYNRLYRPLAGGDDKFGLEGGFGAFRDRPDLINKFLGGTRMGEESYDEVRESLVGLADAANGAQIDITAMAEGAAQVAELNQSIGGTAKMGREKAISFTNSTGLAPDRLATLMQNPMVQGMIATQTGLPPQLQGLVGTGGMMNGISQTMDFLEQSGQTAGAAFGTIKNAIKDPATGKILGYEKIGQKKIGEAFAATQMGLSPEEYRNMKRDEEKTQASGALEAILHDKKLLEKNAGGNVVSLAKQSGISRASIDAANEAFASGDAFKGRRELEQGLQEARKKEAREGQLDSAQKVSIDLTPRAAEMFRKLGGDAATKSARDDANAGKGTITDMANRTQGPRPLTSTGQGVTHGKGF